MCVTGTFCPEMGGWGVGLKVVCLLLVCVTENATLQELPRNLDFEKFAIVKMVHQSGG